MSADTKAPGTKAPHPDGIMGWPRRLALVSAIAVTGAVLTAALTAAAAWVFRAPVLEQYLKHRMEFAGATASLSVAAFDTDRLVLNDIRIRGAADVNIKSLKLHYVFDEFPSGRILSIEATDLRFAQGEFRANAQTITGNGAFTLGIGGFRLIQTDLDILRAALEGEPINPSRLTVMYRDDALSFETTLPGARGHIALFGQGRLTEHAPPFRITASGRLDPTLLPFMTHEYASREAISFTVNAEISEFLAAVASLQKGAGELPRRFSADGELALDLGRVSIAGHAIGTPGRDRVRFRLEDVATKGATTRGRATIDVDIGPRNSETFDFARANLTLRADVERDKNSLTIAFRPGSEGRLFDLRLPGGPRLDGETIFRLADSGNRIVFDLKNKTARHRIQAEIARRNSQLRLQSEGDPSDADDPVVFTLQGTIDPAPLLAMIPNVDAASGIGEIFVAGEAMGGITPGTARQRNSMPSPMLRLDGATTFRIKGLTLEGTEKIDATTDHVTLRLKAFKATPTWRQGNFDLSVRLGARRVGPTSLKSVALSANGQLRSTDTGYRIRLAPGSVLNLGEIRSPLLNVRNHLRLALDGNKNTVDTDKGFRPSAASLRFAEIDTLGALTKRSGHRTPFRLRLPWITGTFSQKGVECHGENGTLTLPKLAVAAQGLSLTARTNGPSFSASLKARDVRHRARRPLLSPMSLSANADIRGGTISAQIRARQFASPLSVNATVEHDYQQNSGRLRIWAPQFALKGPQYRLGDMFPVAIGWFDTIRGVVAANAEWNWDRDLTSGRATITANGVDLAIQDLRISGMNGAVNFIELAPLLMPPRQRLTGKLAFADLGPLPFRAEFQLNENGSIAVQDLDINVGGGRTRTRGIVSIGDSGLTAEGKVEATSIALGDAFHILGIDGLEGSGRVSGTLPIELRNDVVRIKAGHLTADAPGRLRYDTGSLERQLIGTPKQKASTIKALSDFRFKSLDVALDNTSVGSGSVRMQLRGTNPSVYDGNEFSMEMQAVSDMSRLERLVLGGLHTVADVSRQADSAKPRH